MMQHRAAGDFRAFGYELRGRAGITELGEAIDRRFQNRNPGLRALALLPAAFQRDSLRFELSEPFDIQISFVDQFLAAPAFGHFLTVAECYPKFGYTSQEGGNPAKAVFDLGLLARSVRMRRPDE